MTDAFKKKQALWNSLVEKEDATMFLNLNGYVSSIDINHKEVLNIVSKHLIGYQFRSLFSSRQRSSTLKSLDQQSIYPSYQLM